MAQGEIPRFARNDTGKRWLAQSVALRFGFQYAGVHSDSRYRVWQRRFYPYGVYSEKKRLEKLNYFAQQSGEEGLRTFAGGMALELQVLLS
jgi:hypothetical protein